MAVPGPDLSTVGILGVVVLLEGLRTVPARAVVVRRFPWAEWRVALVERERSRLRLVSWWPPLSRSLVLPAGGVDSGTDVAARVARVRSWVAPLEMGGFVALVGLVLGVPLGTAWAGTWGLLVSVCGVFAWALALTAASAIALGRLGIPRRKAVRDAAPLLSPFAAARAAELVMERALVGAGQLAVVEALLPAESFAAWIRPRAYDLARGGVPDPELEALHPRSHWDAAAAAVPAGRAGRDPAYCPRCGAWYRYARATCADCEGIALTPT